MFICPSDSVQQSVDNYRLVYAMADNDSEIYNSASNLVIVECSKGERGYVESSGSGGEMYGQYGNSTFSGFLLHFYF